MIEFRRRVRASVRLFALRELYRTFHEEKTSQARGRRLLRDWLSPDQLVQFNSRGYFDVVGCDTGKRYRIRHGISANVHEIDDWGRLGTGWCFVPEERLVEGDVMLAQKIALETNELRTLAIANNFPPILRWGFARERRRC